MSLFLDKQGARMGPKNASKAMIVTKSFTIIVPGQQGRSFEPGSVGRSVHPGPGEPETVVLLLEPLAGRRKLSAPHATSRRSADNKKKLDHNFRNWKSSSKRWWGSIKVLKHISSSIETYFVLANATETLNKNTNCRAAVVAKQWSTHLQSKNSWGHGFNSRRVPGFFLLFLSLRRSLRRCNTTDFP